MLKKFVGTEFNNRTYFDKLHINVRYKQLHFTIVHNLTLLNEMSNLGAYAMGDKLLILNAHVRERLETWGKCC